MSRQGQGGSKVPPSLISKLVPLLPALLEWLRDRDLLNASKALQHAAFFLTFSDMSYKVDWTKVDDALLKLAAVSNKGPMAGGRKKRGKTNNYSSNSDFHLLMLEKDLQVWYLCVLRILSESNPPAIPPGMCNLAIAENPELKRADSIGMLRNLKEWMRFNFEFRCLIGFGELCSFLRDSLSLSGASDQLKPVSIALGGLIIDRDAAAKNTNLKASNILEICIKQCYKLFDDLPQKNSNWMVRGCRVAVRPKDKDARFDKLRQDLITFYQLKDSRYVAAAPLLMQNYNVYQVALGVLVKYECLPLGWKETLLEGHKNGHPEAAWFNPTKITFVSEGFQTLMLQNARYRVPKKARKMFQELKAAQKQDGINEVVEELLEKALEYQRGLEQFMNEYVAEIRFIADNEAFGIDAKQSLGISTKEIDCLMGRALKNVIKLERKIAAELQVLKLLPCELTSRSGRAGYICKVMLRNSEEMIKCYTDYNKTYQQGSSLLKKLMASVPSASKSITGTGNVHMNFMEIFNELKYSSNLAASSVDLALQTPVLYVTKLPLFFEKMKKTMDKGNRTSEPAYKMICEAFAKVRHVMSEIDRLMAEKTPQSSSTSTLRKLGRGPAAGGLLAKFGSPAKSARSRRKKQQESLLGSSYKNTT